MSEADKIVFISIYFIQLTVWCVYSMQIDSK